MFVINRGFSDYNSIAFSREVDGVLYGAKAEKMDGAVEVHRIRVLNVGPNYRMPDHKTRIKYMKARLMAILTILLLGVGAWMMPYKNVNCCFIAVAVIVAVDAMLYHCSIAKFLERFWFRFSISSASSNRKHCAEHKAINAYHKLKRIPTVLEVKKASRFSAKCGDVRNIGCVQALIVFGFMGMILNLIGVTDTKVIFLYFVTCGIYAMIYDHDLYKYLGWFSLEKPTDAEIQMAISALELYDQFQSELAENKENALKNLEDVFYDESEAKDE